MAMLGKVVAIDDGIATVELIKNSVCSECIKKDKIGACDGCSNKEETVERVIAYNKAGAAIGDEVDFVKSKGKNALFIFISFIFPIIVALLSYFVTALFSDDDYVKSKVAIAAFFVCMAIAALYSYYASKSKCDYAIVSIVEDN